jgi:uncharacterized membrane protein
VFAKLTYNKGGVSMSKRSVSNNKSSRSNKSSKNNYSDKRNKFLFPGIILGLVAVIVASIVTLRVNAKDEATNDHIHTDAKGETHIGLNITKSEVSQNVKFYPYKVDNVKMEVLAVKSKDGVIRTALNTCESCYNSGRGYYKQQGDLLVCQNCGNSFSLDKVGMQQDGCNPVPIPSQYKTDTEDSIIVSKTFLTSKKSMFTNWGK